MGVGIGGSVAAKGTSGFIADENGLVGAMADASSVAQAASPIGMLAAALCHLVTNFFLSW